MLGIFVIKRYETVFVIISTADAGDSYVFSGFCGDPSAFSVVFRLFKKTGSYCPGSDLPEIQRLHGTGVEERIDIFDESGKRDGLV